MSNRRCKAKIVVFPYAIDLIVCKEARSDFDWLGIMLHKKVGVLAWQKQLLLKIWVPRCLLHSETSVKDIHCQRGVDEEGAPDIQWQP